MKISVILRNYATQIAISAAVVALILFVPAALTDSILLRVFLIILIVGFLGGGGALLFWGSRQNGPQVHYFLFDRRRARSRRRDELNESIVQDGMAYYLRTFAKDQLSLWKELPKPLRLQLDAQEQFRPLVTYRLLYLLSECEADQVYQIFSEANANIVTYLCRAISDAGDPEMADFIYHLKQKRIADRERIVQFFQKNKQCFATRALRLVERDFELFYVSKNTLVK